MRKTAKRTLSRRIGWLVRAEKDARTMGLDSIRLYPLHLLVHLVDYDSIINSDKNI